ncbi:MAG: twin-arginine translocase TatA/TatE family subunit [Bacteroidetes bacterium]|nr:twin-arginine translocase TatA/TatE family subunit [Bacteroidota bacterium]
MIGPSLFLNDVAGTEILVIFMVILLFFGSKSIPGIAKSLGKALFQFRNATNEIKHEIKKSSGDVKGDLNMNSLIKETADEFQQPMDQVFSEVDHSVHYNPGRTIENSPTFPGNNKENEPSNENTKKE